MKKSYAVIITTFVSCLVEGTSAEVETPWRVEISPDSHQRTVIPSHQIQSMTIKRSDEVPYGTEPDWQNTLRRQVGGLQVADMNGDSLIDVIVGCYISNSYPPYEYWYNYIYYNIGGELEADPSWISTDEVSTGDIQIAKINDDIYPDIFAANGGFAMSPSVIYFGSPSGPSTVPGWSSAEPSAAWNNYALPFDYDHDGDVDVATANQGNSPSDPYRPMYIFRNVDGVLETVPFWQSAESSIQNFLAFGDLDGDEWEDLAVSKWANFQSGTYRNVAGAMQTVPNWTTGDDDTDKGVALADVDGNEWLDLALGHDPTQLFSNTGGTLSLAWSSLDSYFGHSDLRFHDVDGDGDQDLADIHFSNGHVNIYLNRNGTLDTTPSWTYDCSSVGTAIAFGDINGNGRPDLIVGNSGDISVMVFYAESFPCPADLTGDQQVNIDDIFAILGLWGDCPDPCPPYCEI